MVEKMLDMPVESSQGIAAALSEQIQVYRHELKYFTSFSNHKILSEVFRNTMEKDPHVDENNEYWIRSLYFDTIENDDFYDKEMGIKVRKKIRLRIYSIHQSWVKIEIKNKYDQYMLKETTSLSKEEAKALIGGCKEILLNRNNSTLNRAYYLMTKDYYRPVVIVDYEREAYISPIQNIRITFDKNIRGSSVDFDMFNSNLNMQAIFDNPTMVVEVKYNKFLPTWITEILSAFHSTRYAISKYCLGRHLY